MMASTDSITTNAETATTNSLMAVAKVIEIAISQIVKVLNYWFKCRDITI